MKFQDQIWFRYSLWVASFVLVIWLAFAFLSFFLFQSQLSKSIDNSLEISASQALAAVNIEDAQLNFSDSLPDLSALSTVLEGGFLVQILDSSGTLRMSSGKLAVAVPSIAEVPLLNQQFFFSAGSQVPIDLRFRAISSPIIVENKQIGTLRIYRGLSSVNEALERLLFTLLAMLPLFIATAFLGSALIAKRSLSPLSTMIAKAAQITGSSLEERLPQPKRQDEIGSLALVFNELLDRLEQAFIHEKRFTADASHELRTPLTAIQSIIGVTLSRKRDGPHYRSALADIQAEAARLVAITNDLLYLARPQGPDAAFWELFDLGQLVQDVTDSLEPLAIAKGVVMNCSLAAITPITGDRDALARVFFNLVGNAIKFTTSGSIDIQVQTKKGSGPRVIIADTGPGIALDQLNHIFERFYRGSVSRTGGGAGLGLSLASEIVKRHRGQILVESHPGQGSVFTVLLPG